jgi:hypothetical protein
MNKERDLLPWILGGLSAATIAVAFAAVSTYRNVPTLAPTPSVAAQPTVRAPVATPALQPPSTAQASALASAPASVPESAPVLAPPQAQTAVEPEVQAGQIWECTTKGVKTFSNNPCGEKSTLLDVSPINTMSATPAVHYAHANGSEPRYAQGYSDQGAPADEEPYSEDYGAETGGDSYTVIPGFVAHRRPEHSHRPSPHHNSGHNSGHTSGTARRY